MKNLSYLIFLVPLLFFMSTGIGESLSDESKTLEQMVEDGDDIVLIDVRTPEEYNAGHILGAINIPYDTIAELITDVPKDSQIVLYCRSGRRSGIAADVLKEMGYTKILDYKRFSDWKGEVVK